MSWSYGAIHEKGLILKENDFKNLLKLSNSFKEEYELDNDDIDDIFNTSTEKTKSTGKQLGKKKQRGKINYEVEKEYENTKKNTHTNEQIDF